MNANRTPEETREKTIINQMSTVGIAGNIVLFLFKLVAGVIGNSGAMVSDAVHSLSDVFATAIAFIGTRISRKQADDGHPYGHDRIESVAALLLGAILVATGLGIGWAGVQAVINGAYVQSGGPEPIAAVAALVSIGVKEAMFWYTRHYAHLLGSSAFMADAWHHRTDALSSVGALAGILAAIAGYPVFDAVASIAISGFVLYAAAEIIRDAFGGMLDEACDEQFVDEVRTCLESQPGVVRVDMLATRRFGSKAYVDAEIAIDGSKTLDDAHAIAHAAHDEVERRFPNIKHVMIHMNPA